MATPASFKRSHFKLPGKPEIGQTMVFEVTGMVTNLEIEPVDVRRFGEDDEDASFLPGELSAEVSVTHVKRLAAASDSYDPAEREKQLEAQIMKLESKFRSEVFARDRRIRGLMEKNPDEAYVPALRRTIEHLNTEIDRLKTKEATE